MTRNLILWSLTFGMMSVLGACASDTTGSNVAAVQEAIGDCQDQLAGCDASADDCETGAMDCMNAVDGNGATEDDVTKDCDDLYDLCLTKSDDVAFCEDLRDRKSTRLNSSHTDISRMPSSA